MLTQRQQWVVIGALVVALILSVRSCAGNRNATVRAITAMGRTDSILDVYVDLHGREHSLLVERDFTLAELEYSHDSEMVALRADLGKKIKDLQSRTVVHTVTRDTVITTVHDTVRNGVDTGQVFQYTDEWATIHGSVFDTTATLDYAFRDGVSLDRTWTRPKWYKRKELTLDVTMLNPHAHLEGIQTYVIKPDPVPWYGTRGFQITAGFMAGFILGSK